MKHHSLFIVGLLLCATFAFGQTIQKGDFLANVESEGWTLSSGSGDRTYIQFITFDKPFESTPTVMVSLVGCDAATDKDGGLRVHMAVDKITKVGCVVKIKTWGTSKVNAVWGDYLAFSK